MAKKGQGKCVICGEWLPVKDLVKIDNRNYCVNCAMKVQKKRLKEQKYNKELNDFLYSLCGKEKDLMPFLCTQVRRLKDNNGWKTESILYTLRYIFCISENPPVFNPEYGIQGLVEKNYCFAKKYYADVFYLHKIPEDEIIKRLTISPKKTVLKRSNILKGEEYFKEKKKNLIYGPELDLNDILNDDIIEEEKDKGGKA